MSIAQVPRNDGASVGSGSRAGCCGAPRGHGGAIPAEVPTMSLRGCDQRRVSVIPAQEVAGVVLSVGVAIRAPGVGLA
jgi:hypothetical protein